MKSITAKILSVLTVLLLVVGAIISATLYWSNGDELQQEFAQDQQNLSKQLEVILQEPVYVYDKDIIQSIIESFNSNSMVADISVVDHRGQSLGQTNSSTAADDSFTVPLAWEGKPIGEVKVGISHLAMQKTLDQLLMQSVLSVLATIALAVIVLVSVLQKLVLQPLQKVNSVLGDIASGGGDLTARIPVETQDEIGQLSGRFNAFIETIQNIIKDMSVASESLDKASASVSSIVENARRSNATQMELTSSSATNIEHLDVATQEIAQSTESTVQKANQACDVADKSKASIEANINNIRSLVDNLEIATEEVASLKDTSDNIGSVLDVIKGIAEQTNLLALNAAIEAARAGESGRGFAVVADEVRALASKTHDSTTEIETIIEELQKRAEASHKATQASKSMVGETIDQAQQTGVALEQISSEMTGINDMVIMISSACEEQSNVTQLVSNDMAQLKSGAEQLEQESSHTEQVVNQLIDIGGQLTSQIARFKY
ncbi:methyl-accepting chemotaxis protein [Vibrio sp. SCSIO 43136]|uniref:methyl-accepting chemotaxis protein n=1 Tax=Vibrio sp. SCSIO 43136 TaxID=2819101 RepID=UPI002075FBDD|nr:methyl-accepting chemotaxis protein [Vibrio sp. SCSIO 43136]USD67526.1 methyl-accepting chemotaxis protein [Vibrio sp. SCSIO 43136]